MTKDIVKTMKECCTSTLLDREERSGLKKGMSGGDSEALEVKELRLACTGQWWGDDGCGSEKATGVFKGDWCEGTREQRGREGIRDVGHKRGTRLMVRVEWANEWACRGADR